MSGALWRDGAVQLSKCRLLAAPAGNNRSSHGDNEVAISSNQRGHGVDRCEPVVIMNAARKIP